MRSIKYKNALGGVEHTFFPTTTRDLYQLFSCYGMDAMVMKYGGRYDICFPGPKDSGGPLFIVNVGRKVDCMTAKAWVAIADAHCPDRNRYVKGEYYQNMKRYVELETLEAPPRHNGYVV